MAKKKIKNSPVLTARDLLNGYVANNYDYNLYNMTPLQMVPQKEKNEEWKKWNLDWYERVGLNQLAWSSKRIIKNYHLANGIIDKTDYIIGPDNDMSEIISNVSIDGSESLPIRFFPIIPNIINVLVGEFSKRDSRIIVKATDEQSTQEAYDYKYQLITEILTNKALQERSQQLMQMGLSPEDPNTSEQFQQELDVTKQLIEAEQKFKSYRGIAEKWANHMIQLDNDRFKMYQLESTGFRDMLVCDREFWHIKLSDHDYKVELWEPWNVFYHKSPSVEYTSEGNYIGRIIKLSIPDVIDIYGDKMKEDQINSLKNQYKLLSNFSLVTDAYVDRPESFYDFSRPYSDNWSNVTMQKYENGLVGEALQGRPTSNHQFNLSWEEMMKNSTSDPFGISGPGMVRVTEVYWKSQRKVFELTWIKKDGTLVTDTVDENYKVTEQPVYDRSMQKAESKETLISGEHLDPIWINEVRWGVKINSLMSTAYSRHYNDMEPIYIGGDPLPFQFKGDRNLYGCKLPVEGKIFSERGSYSSSLVDKMKPNQISYNIVNNQIVEMLADEIGNVLVMDPNTIPRNSLGGEWGKHNYSMFHQVMKDHQVAPIDVSVRNTESATNFQHFQTVDLSKTNQIITRLKLAEYFKTEAFAVVGVTPQRLGDISASESATGIQQASQASYTQTEPYFDQHMNHLMPRVRQMMLDAAQFIASTKPHTRETYMNRDEENVFFDITGTDLLLRDFMVMAKSTSDVKALRDKLENLAMQTIAAGGSLVDAAKTLSIQSPAEIIANLEKSEDKRQQEIEAQRKHEAEMQQMQQQFLEAQEAKALENENYWKERELQQELYIKDMEMRAATEGTGTEIDPIQAAKLLHQQSVDANSQLNADKKSEIENKKIQIQMTENEKDRQLDREKMENDYRLKKMDLKNKVAGEK